VLGAAFACKLRSPLVESSVKAQSDTEEEARQRMAEVHRELRGKFLKTSLGSMSTYLIATQDAYGISEYNTLVPLSTGVMEEFESARGDETETMEITGTRTLVSVLKPTEKRQN